MKKTEKIKLMNVYKLRNEFINNLTIKNKKHVSSKLVVPISFCDNCVFFIFVIISKSDNSLVETETKFQISDQKQEKTFIAKIQNFYKIRKDLFLEITQKTDIELDFLSKYNVLSKSLEVIERRKEKFGLYNVSPKLKSNFTSV